MYTVTPRLIVLYSSIPHYSLLTINRMSTARDKMPLFRVVLYRGDTTHPGSRCFHCSRQYPEKRSTVLSCYTMLHLGRPHQQPTNNADASIYSAQMVCSVRPTSDIWVSDLHPSVSSIQCPSSRRWHMSVPLGSTRFSVSVSILFQIPIYRLPGLWISHFVYAVLFALLLSCLMQLLARRGA